MRRLVIITGASRGFGRSLALEAAKAWGGSKAGGYLDMHLIARSESGLAETQRAAEAVASPDGLRVWTHPMDLGDLDALAPRLGDLLEAMVPPSSPSSASITTYDKAVLFNNAGLVGPIAYAQDLRRDWAAIRKAVDVNVTSFVYLTAFFLEAFGPQHRSRDPPSQDQEKKSLLRAQASVVVNVSSLAAVQPFESWAMYCAGKAARDMFTAVIAKEQQATGATTQHKTLNYAPGPLDTDMQAELRESATLHAATRDWSLEMFREGKLVRPEASAAKCLRILEGDRFASGAHVDYYDSDV